MGAGASAATSSDAATPTSPLSASADPARLLATGEQLWMTMASDLGVQVNTPRSSELRRLHAENRRLRGALARKQPGGSASPHSGSATITAVATTTPAGADGENDASAAMIDGYPANGTKLEPPSLTAPPLTAPPLAAPPLAAPPLGKLPLPLPPPPRVSVGGPRGPPPSLSAGKDAPPATRKRWKIVEEDPPWTFDQGSLTSSARLGAGARLDWSLCEALGKSSDGSSGVFFAAFRGGAGVVMKPAEASLGLELFGNLLAEHIGVDTPCVVVVDSEGKSEGWSAGGRRGSADEGQGGHGSDGDEGKSGGGSGGGDEGKNGGGNDAGDGSNRGSKHGDSNDGSDAHGGRDGSNGGNGNGPSDGENGPSDTNNGSAAVNSGTDSSVFSSTSMQSRLSSLVNELPEHKRGPFAALVRPPRRMLLSEYVVGSSLNNVFGPSAMAEEWCARIMHAENFARIGRMLALDVLINNMDRLPLIWNNNGNPCNVMVAKDGRVLAIDNTPFCIDPELHVDAAATYADRVEALVRGAAQCTPGTTFANFDRIQRLLLDGAPDGWPGLGYDLDTAGMVVIQQGLLEGCTAISALTRVDLELFRSRVQAATEDGDDDGQKVLAAAGGMQGWHIEFMLTVIAACRRGLDL